jgi:CheY-like chemotaxis protein
MPVAEPQVVPERSVSPQRVMIVDDHEGMRTSLGRLLRHSGHDIAEATSGAEALVLADTFRPDAAIVDVSLGDMSGIDLAQRLRKSHQGLQLLALTGYRDPELRNACLAAGFDAYLVKPEGISQIPKMLGRRRPAVSEAR